MKRGEEMKELVIAWMVENGVSEAELAEKMGVSEAWVANVLFKGRRISASRMDHLSQVTGLSVHELLGFSADDFAGYHVMTRGGVKALTEEQKKEILDVALLSNDYEWVRERVLGDANGKEAPASEQYRLTCTCGRTHQVVLDEASNYKDTVYCDCGKHIALLQKADENS